MVCTDASTVVGRSVASVTHHRDPAGDHTEVIPHLFRTESGRIASVLCRRFGIGQMQIAEDITAETFLKALETWPYNGIPANPAGWLHKVAVNKAITFLHRQRITRDKMQALPKEERDSPSLVEAIDMTERNITDSQLQMLFAICHPALSAATQIGLALRILCGLGIEEIANAFLTNKDTINKRLFRGKEKLRTEGVEVTFPHTGELDERLANVLATLYLLFSEGYYSESDDRVLREDLCLEAMRLTYLLLENGQTNRSPVNALFALMCFHASRFAARRDASGEMLLYEQQDESLWNKQLIEKGVRHLHRASLGPELSRYHLEASIAYWHTVKNDTRQKWESILKLYDQLLQIAHSPLAALNRIFAFSKIHGKPAAIEEALTLQLADNQYYSALLGALHEGLDREKAVIYYRQALSLAKTIAERNTLKRKLATI